MKKLFLILSVCLTGIVHGQRGFIKGTGDTIWHYDGVNPRVQINKGDGAIPPATLTDSCGNIRTDLNSKAPLASPAFTGTPTGITAAHVGLGNVTNESKATMFTSPAFTGTPTGITATHVGLGSVNNTSDAGKPVSTAQQTALDLKANLASPTFTGTVVLPNSTVTNAMLAGSIDLTAKVTGVLPAANGGTGVNNSTRTLTVNTNAGTIAFPTASTTQTLPASTSTVVGRVATAQIASTASATSTTTLFTPPADGFYRVSIYLKITTTGTSPVAGPVTITYTDALGSVAQSHVMLLQSVTGTVVTTTVNNSTTTGTVNGSMVIYAKSAVAIQYAIAVSGTFGAGRYQAFLTCEAL